MLTDTQLSALVVYASKARDTAYAPYSRFKVGAALVCDDDRVFYGCNVENASYGLSVCAERSAAASAVANGSPRIKAIVIVTDTTPPSTPCGACRQWLSELGGPSCQVICANTRGEVRRFVLRDLLPEAFTL
jgi:cytidine deaminase